MLTPLDFVPEQTTTDVPLRFLSRMSPFFQYCSCYKSHNASRMSSATIQLSSLSSRDYSLTGNSRQLAPDSRASKIEMSITCRRNRVPLKAEWNDARDVIGLDIKPTSTGRKQPTRLLNQTSFSTLFLTFSILAQHVLCQTSNSCLAFHRCNCSSSLLCRSWTRSDCHKTSFEPIYYP